MKRVLVLSVLLIALLGALGGGSAAASEELGAQLASSTFAGGVTVAPDGTAWFSASYLGGEYKRIVGKVGGDGKATEYEAPGGANSLAAGSDGNVWFTELHAIGRITPEGQISSFKLPKGAGEPEALTLASDGDIWFVTVGPVAVGMITPAGAVTMFPLKGAGRASSIAAGPAGDLWFTEPEGGRIGRVTTTGEETEFRLPGNGARPNAITLGSDGNLWFSDGSKARVGRITPSGQVTYFTVPTLTSTDGVVAGPAGEIWFTAQNEIGKISTAGKVSWPQCFTTGCQFPPVAMTVAPDGRLWVATGEGHCPGYCGGGSELMYIFGSSSIGPYAGLPSSTVGIGPRLSPVENGHTTVTIGCGEAAPCSGILRLRARVKTPGSKHFSTRLLGQVPYAFDAGEIKSVAVPFALRTWNHLKGNRRFVLLDAVQGGTAVGHRGFYVDAPRKEGGIEKHW